MIRLRAGERIITNTDNLVMVKNQLCSNERQQSQALSYSFRRSFPLQMWRLVTSLKDPVEGPYFPETKAIVKKHTECCRFEHRLLAWFSPSPVTYALHGTPMTAVESLYESNHFHPPTALVFARYLLPVRLGSTLKAQTHLYVAAFIPRVVASCFSERISRAVEALLPPSYQI